MLYAKADERVAGYLGRALSLELSAVQLYSTQAQLVATWGLKAAAERFKEETREELDHAERIIGRMLALGLAPSASQLRPVRLGQCLSELLTYNRQFESELIRLYSNAERYCARQGDIDNRMFFGSLLEEERAHEAEFAAWLAELDASAFPSTTTGRATF